MSKNSLKIVASLLALLILGASQTLADSSYIQRALRSFEAPTTTIAPPPASSEIAFSPNGGATELIIKTIRSAQSSIRVAAYSFTSRPIAKALIEAHKAGIDVAVLVDHSQTQKSSHSVVGPLVKENIPVRADIVHAIQHDKYIVVDEKTVETGSFNYSAAAENNNSENVLVLWNSPEIAATYLKNWNALWEQAEPYYGEP